MKNQGCIITAVFSVVYVLLKCSYPNWRKGKLHRQVVEMHNWEKQIMALICKMWDLMIDLPPHLVSFCYLPLPSFIGMCSKCVAYTSCFHLLPYNGFPPTALPEVVTAVKCKGLLPTLNPFSMCWRLLLLCHFTDQCS